METFDLLMGGVGTAIGTYFIVFLYKQSRTLVGSFFRGYYKRMILASFIFGIGFLTVFLDRFGIESETTEMIHHTILIIAGILFILSGMRFLKEAAKVIKE